MDFEKSKSRSKGPLEDPPAVRTPGTPLGATRLGPERCAFEAHVELKAMTAARVRAGLDAVARSLATCSLPAGALAPGPFAPGILALDGDPARSVAVWLAAANRRLGARTVVPGDRLMIDREEALDLAAALLEIADALFRVGLPVEALALEGIESHLIGALVTPSGPGH